MKRMEINVSCHLVSSCILSMSPNDLTFHPPIPLAPSLPLSLHQTDMLFFFCRIVSTVAGPISSPGCPWQFGIFPEGSPDECSPTYSECVWGVPERKYCERGLVYDERIKGCQWPDQKGCRGEGEYIYFTTMNLSFT